MNDADQDWFDRNRAALRAAGDVARLELAAAFARAGAGEAPSDEVLAAAREAERAACAATPDGCALDRLADAFGLSPFERRIVAALATAVWDREFARETTLLRPGGLSFGRALEAFAEAHWSATVPGGPLRRWRLVEPGEGSDVLCAPLALDERILHELLGAGGRDARVAARARGLAPVGPLTESRERIAGAIAALWQDAAAARECPAVVVEGVPRPELIAVARRAAEVFGAEAWLLDAAEARAADGTWVTLWERETLLAPAVLVLDLGESEAAPADLVRLAERVRGPVVVCGGPWPAGVRARRSFAVRRATADERAAAWRGHLGPAAATLNGALERAAAQFQLSDDECAAAFRAAGGAADRAPDAHAFWRACRRVGRSGLEGLAERIETRARRGDLVLPAAQLGLIDELVAAARNRHTIAETWGFAGKSARGLGVAALFAGPSGTGKTMAAEVVAGELDLDLHRIDLSAVVSKYIGETEKNLRRLFDAADRSGAVLLFDEADALFGKRSEVKDGHDRYANIEVGYLLQRIEAYRGVSILTTNLRQSLDEAFQRRLRFVVSFPFPDPAARERIWRCVFPAAAPCGDLRWAALARLNVPGGSIRNIALGAAVLAAEEKSPIEMRHLARAARTEGGKLERTLAASELAGWE